MSVNTCLINRCFSSASTVIRSWFIYELQKSTPEIPPVKSPHAFRFPIINTPLSLRNSSSKNPTLPFGNPESRPWHRTLVWIFSGISGILSQFDDILEIKFLGSCDQRPVSRLVFWFLSIFIFSTGLWSPGGGGGGGDFQEDYCLESLQ